jgi:hypothetical protein
MTLVKAFGIIVEAKGGGVGCQIAKIGPPWDEATKSF